MDTISKLSAVLNTLDDIEVKGRANLDRLLGCIQTVEEVLRMLTTPQLPTEETTKRDALGQEVKNG